MAATAANLLLYLLYKMALIDRVEINIANNAKLYANAQYVFAFMRAIRPKSIIKTYDPK